METWPTIFPAPSAQFTGKKTGTVVRTKMETGRTRRRRRFTSQIHTYSVKFDLTDFQLGMFEAWFLHKINDGADAFEIPLATGGEELKTVVASFQDDTYQQSYDGVMFWHLTATLEVEDAEIWPEEDYDALLLVGDPLALEEAVEHVTTYVGS
jgi:hypothetical protein